MVLFHCTFGIYLYNSGFVQTFLAIKIVFCHLLSLHLLLGD